ncbi:MAG: AAA family ATPase [Candidatus Thorarchaeota archaeon]|nr:AAA family ATPase [Candidatus Thorarchaeota archaeon]
MKLLNLEVRNFKPFRELILPEDEDELPGGLILVRGPNSTGKSSLFEAILWGLWGADAVGLTNDELISFSSTYCKVIVTFDVAGDRYKIDRSYNPADGMSVVLFLKKGNAWKRIADKSKSVSTKLDEIFSLELRQALNTILVRQGEVAAIANSTPSVLRNLLIDVYDIEILNRMSKHLEDLESNLDSEIDSRARSYRSPEDIQEEIQRCHSRINRYNESIKQRKDEITSTEKLLADIPDIPSLRKVSEINSKMERQQQELTLVMKELQRYLSQAGLLEADDTLIHARLESLDRERERVESERSLIETTIQKIDQEIGISKGRRTDFSDKINTLTGREKTEAVCPTCSKPLSASERDSLVSEYKKAITDGDIQIRELEKQRDHHSESIKKIDGRLTVISKSSDAADNVKDTHTNVREIQQKISTSEHELQQILDSMGVKDFDVFLKKFNVDSIASLQSKVESLTSMLKEAKKGTSEIEENILQEQEQIADLESKEVLMKQLGAEIEEMKQLNEHAKYVRRKLVSGFVADYVFQKRLLGIIRSATNQYVRFFTNGQYTSVDLEPTAPTKRSGPGLLLKIWDERDQAWKKTSQLSYGDRTAISLALRLGISRTMSSIRPLRDSPIMIPRMRSVLLDEPLGGLDKSRRESVVTNLVNDKNFEQILLITHTDVQGWEDVPIIEVSKSGAGSRAVLIM